MPHATPKGQLAPPPEIPDPKGDHILNDRPWDGLTSFPPNNPNPLLMVSRQGILLYANKASLPVLAHWRRRIGQEIPHPFIQLVRNVARTGASTTLRADIGRRTFDFFFTTDSEGRNVFLYGGDVTASGTIEERLRKAAQRLRTNKSLLSAIIEGTSDAVYVKDLQGRYVMANPATASFAGILVDEMVGRDDAAIHPHETAARIMEEDRRVISTGERFTSEDVLITSEGPRTFLSLRIPHRDDRGDVIGVIGVSRDITERKRVEETMSHLAAIVNSSDDAIIGKTLDGIITSWNPAAERIYGFSAADALGRSISLISPPDRPDEVKSLLDRIRAGERLDHHETSCVREDGTRIVVSLTISLIRAPDGRVVGASTIARDVTEQQRGEEKLRASEARFRSLTQSATDAIISADSSGNIASWNEGARAIFQFEESEILGRPLALIIPERYRESHLRGLDRFRATGVARVIGKTIELYGLRKDGKEFPIELSLGSWRTGDERFYCSIIRDITERKQVEKALRASEERFRQIAENLPQVIWLITPARDQMMYVSFAYERVWGRACESLYDNPRSWMEALHPDDRDRVIQAFDHDDLGNFDLEYRIFRTDGSIRWIQSRAFPVRDERGRVLRVAGISEDITQRKLLESKVVQSQKLESIGQLAAGIAHEINTPTQYVGDNTRFLQDAFADLRKVLEGYEALVDAAKQGRLEPSLLDCIESAEREADIEYLNEEIPKAIQQSLEGIERVSKIVGAMKEFSHPNRDEKAFIDINKAIESSITVARNEWKYVADVVTDLDAELPPVPCLPGEFNQAILNIVLNASHAIAETVEKEGGGKGRITVKTRRDGDWADIRIEDTGSGIPEPIRSKVFDPFFTTKEVGKGTGQGLAIAHSVIVAKHGGTLDFETEVGCGTTFLIRLPLHEDPPLFRRDAFGESTSAFAAGSALAAGHESQAPARSGASRAEGPTGASS